GIHTFTFTVAGKNANSTGYALSLDDLTLKPE
ncbi:MAG: hypothetical protein QOH35_1214, partial [Acidobacteriaceae bacterium]|nr:hypothetical protein [Acidobacteriaceae bacterium]